MKSKIPKITLELALAHCYDATEKKASESITQFAFKDKELTLKCKGAFTFFEETISNIELDEDCTFSLKTSLLLEFVKHITSDSIFVVFDNQKKTCLISGSDKKSKLALQSVDCVISDSSDDEYDISFNVTYLDFINKLTYASRFCALNFESYPLTAIHCHIKDTKLQIQSTNGMGFYQTSVDKELTEELEIYIPKKSPIVIKNIFGDGHFEKISVNKNNVMFKSDRCKLKIFLEKCEFGLFPEQIVSWLDEQSVATIDVSSYELSNTIKLFNSLFNECSVCLKVGDDKLEVFSEENGLAVKETVVVENCTGESNSFYNSKSIIDCIESIQSSWIKMDFIPRQNEYNLCKFIAGGNIILLCPTIS